jgi:tetratricopeptide (TPR) repeat protein
MAFRFWRRIRLAPGVTLNLSKSSASVSLGPRGAKYTISPLGNRVTAGLPGTGLFYTMHDRTRAGAAPSQKRLNLGFLQRLLIAPEERRFVDGVKALLVGDNPAALSLMEQCPGLADPAWIAGMLSLQAAQLERAEQHLLSALAQVKQLGALSNKYGFVARAQLPVTTDIVAHIGADETGTRLVLAEIAQHQGRLREALQHLERLLVLDPADPVVQVAFAELVMDMPLDRVLLERVVRCTRATGNETPVHTAVLYYRAKALTALGMPTAAIEVLTLANRRHKDRAPALMQQIRYDRAVLYQRVGRKADARREFERLYAQDPDFEDLAQRLVS